tara:strand:+ start:498 stop:1019 length:522 start_codon:yes stop_codon:yes gene_type:complete
LDPTILEDFANAAANEVAKFKFGVILSPTRLLVDDYAVANLNWSHIPYGREKIEQVPDDQRGIYAFVICNDNGILPPHNYVMYIGIAGRNSDRSLRTRYKDYLNEKSVLKRAKIARMIGTWRTVLRFYFAPVGAEVDSDALEAIEETLNNALMPPFSQGDLAVDLKKKRSAFQ